MGDVHDGCHGGCHSLVVIVFVMVMVLALVVVEVKMIRFNLVYGNLCTFIMEFPHFPVELKDTKSKFLCITFRGGGPIRTFYMFQENKHC